MNSIGSQTQLIKTAKELKILQKEHQSEILSLQNNIESIRNELKNLSNSASKIIQKKLNTPKKTKSRPVFNPSFESKKLQQFKDQKEKIFRQIDETKCLIQSIKMQEDPEVKSEIIKRQIKIKEISALCLKLLQEKKYVINELQANKEKISMIKESAYNKDLIENQKVLDQCKKEKAALEKKLNYLVSQQILTGLYLFELKSKVQSLDEATNEKQVNHVSVDQIKTLVAEINGIIENRNEIEKQKDKEISELINLVEQLEKQNTSLKNSYRRLEGQIMKRNLEQRFYKSRMERVSKSIDFLNPNIEYSSVYAPKKTETGQNKPKLKQQTKPFRSSKIKENLIEIGSFELNDLTKLLKDSLSASQKIQKIHSISFILSENKIVGLRSTYMNKEGNKVTGQFLLIQELQKTVEKEVIVKEIKEIEYPLNSKQICLKLIKFNGSVEVIGTEYYGATYKCNISLKNVKNVEFVVEKNKEGVFQKPKGIIIHLESKVPIDKQIKAEEKEEEVKQILDNVFLTSSPSNLRRKAQSIDSISTYKKKAVLKPLKKDVDSNLDHRLLIRKKLV